MPRKVINNYHAIREQCNVKSLENIAEDLTQYIMDNPYIRGAAAFHARQQMKQMDITIPDEMDDCDIYWTLYSEYHIQVMLLVTKKLSPHW